MEDNCRVREGFEAKALNGFLYTKDEGIRLKLEDNTWRLGWKANHWGLIGSGY